MATFEKNTGNAPLEHIDTTEQHMSAKEYAMTRISTLRPPMAKAANPFKLLALLNTQQWMFFLVAFFAWSWDAFDFFTGMHISRDLVLHLITRS
jgi:SHS family lactate transporter-like MFS transporter